MLDEIRIINLFVNSIMDGIHMKEFGTKEEAKTECQNWCIHNFRYNECPSMDSQEITRRIRLAVDSYIDSVMEEVA